MHTENPNLNYYLDKKVCELLIPEAYPLDSGIQERYRIYSLLLMAITAHYWNGNKKGREGKYPLNPVNFGKYEHGDYFGHNIASLAVDAYGDVIDFEFNHNSLFNSSAEHAEARMVKRVYGLTQINDSWKTSLDGARARNDYNTFEDVTLYTTLESCSQCAGTMALARVKEIVYLQTDPGMYLIGNILRNLTRPIAEVADSKGELTSPMPIPGDAFGFRYFDDLNAAYDEFKALVKEQPFFVPYDQTKAPDNKTSITSFLCTELAFRIYKNAEHTFDNMTPEALLHQAYRPTDKEGREIKNAKSNLEALIEAKGFYDYAIKYGKRATPHK